MHLKNGDQVVVTDGNHKGQRGSVPSLDVDRNRVVVEGVNIRTTRIPKTTANPQGGTMEREYSISASSVLLWCDKAGKGVRTRKKTLDDGKRVRVSVSSDTQFDQ